MYTPKFQFLLKIEQFSTDETICLGKQLAQIIKYAGEILEPHFWYGGNIFSLSKNSKQDSFNLFLIGDDNNLLKICDEVEQFLSGVLFAVKKEFLQQDIRCLSVDTEDVQYRELKIDGILIEIRMFDTSFFAIYSESEAIIKELAKKFNIESIKQKS